MTELNDHELLADFARNESEPAFAEMVSHHVNLVYSTALRFTSNSHHAEEITQAVFIILARKAGKLSPRVVLSGWLYQTARLTAANFMKGEIRRQNREQEAYMQSTSNEPEEMDWQQIAPHLDDAIGRLGETDRNAVVLRFFENKTAAEIAAALKTTEAAAHKRVNRALEKLRKIFAKRGVTLTATLIAAAVSMNSVQAAPVGLPAAITATAVKGAGISATLTTLIKGTMKTMTWLKLKFAIGLGVVALMAGGMATVAITQTSSNGKLSTPEIFKKAQETYASLTSYSDDGKSVATLNGQTFTHMFSIKLARPNLYRIEWRQNLGFYAQTGIVWSAGSGDFTVMNGINGTRKNASMEDGLSSAAGVSGGAAATIPGTFFKMQWGNQLGGKVSDQKRQADEKVGDVDCYVFTSDLKGRTRTIWIGKRDFLIHQVRTFTGAAAMKAALDQAAKLHPEIATRMPKVEYSDSTATETHEHIVVNQKLAPAEFAP